MKLKITFLLITVLFVNCDSEKKVQVETEPIEVSDEVINKVQKIETVPVLNLEEANRLAELPLHCMDTEYPNKLNQTIGSDKDLQSPLILHPAFYGCFDWHSAVHGHWSLVSLLKNFPDLTKAEEIKEKLALSISKENIAVEVAYFNGKHNGSYERTYGWAWVLKLAEELHTWDDPFAKALEENLKPLTDLMVNKYIEFLPRLNYPIRVGEHTNTAFGLSFAYDYATLVGELELQKIIEKRVIDFYRNDEGCPISWEPSGFDFLSPCLEEAAIMKRVLSKPEFTAWLKAFLPQIYSLDFNLETGKVSDRSDGKLVHLDGVNFSRAWSMNKIAEDIPELNHLKNVANKHINYSLPSIVGDNYEGGHWLGSFAIYALNSLRND
ncbi:MAG: DUF2891 domain-containing protein [Flavobacteriaceae bacterium]|nr:DUF2891 domain-containing protein [Flavobacteriaceae bacterium]